MTEKELKQSFNKTNYDSVYQKNIKRIIDLLVGIIKMDPVKRTQEKKYFGA